jgi:exodeoxyribonuclease V alpha subunit
VTRPERFPGVPEPLRPFVDATVLTSGQARTAALLCALAGEDRPAVVLATALAVRAPTTGSVCVELRRIAEQVVPAREAPSDLLVADDTGEPTPEPRNGPGVAEVVPAPELEWPDPEGWAQVVAASPLAQVPEGSVPALVVEGDRLYLHRHWVLERYIAADLGDRAQPGPTSAANVDEVHVRTMFAVAAASRGDGRVDERQLEAALAAARSRLVVISGGPGTGKTSTVATLLAGLVRGMGSKDLGSRVRLAAPTGKAAARMTEAIRSALGLLNDELSTSERDTLAGLEATTIHRLLGRSVEGGFDHGPGNPIAADLVIVDEVSMVSVALMAGLLAAVPPTATLVLVGDPDQLASVEAGSVLGDLLGRNPAAGGAASTPRVLVGNAVELATLHRVDGAAQIGDLARLIRSGNTDDVVAALDDGLVGVAWIDPDSKNGASQAAALERELLDRAESLIAAARATGSVGSPGGDELRALLGQLASTKVLAALRRGPTGVDNWNRRMEDHLRRRGLIGYQEWYSGRPVMVLRNDYLNGVFNGDVGVAVRDSSGDHHDVWFPREPDPIGVPSARLGDYTTQWAMSIHKSQGSEFDHVVVTLPPPPSRILTRELLYTAVTRAKQRVTIVATEAAIREAVERPAARASGLTARLS